MWTFICICSIIVFYQTIILDNCTFQNIAIILIPTVTNCFYLNSLLSDIYLIVLVNKSIKITCKVLFIFLLFQFYLLKTSSSLCLEQCLILREARSLLTFDKTMQIFRICLTCTLWVPNNMSFTFLLSLTISCVKFLLFFFRNCAFSISQFLTQKLQHALRTKHSAKLFNVFKFHLENRRTFQH